MTRSLILLLVTFVVATGGLTAGGKRGDPYRPSEIPAKPADS